MTSIPQGLLVSLICAVEIGVICLALFALFQRSGWTFAEAAAYACVSTLMLLSFLFQVAFMAGVPSASFAVEGILVIVSAVTLYRLRRYVGGSMKILWGFAVENPLAAAALGSCWFYLAAQAIFLPPGPAYESELSRVFLFQQDQSFFAVVARSVSHLMTLNVFILPHLFVRFGLNSGIGIFGFLAYLSIGFSVYAMARRYSWPPTAFTVAMVAASMPRLVCHSTSPGFEIIPAAAAVFCLLAINRAVEARPDHCHRRSRRSGTISSQSWCREWATAARMTVS